MPVTVNYCAAVCRRTVTDGNATCQELDLCGMLRPSTYDDAVSVNTSAYGDGIRHALASIEVITQTAPCMLGRSLADKWFGPPAAHHYTDHSATAHLHPSR